MSRPLRSIPTEWRRTFPLSEARWMGLSESLFLDNARMCLLTNHRICLLDQEGTASGSGLGYEKFWIIMMTVFPPNRPERLLSGDE